MPRDNYVAEILDTVFNGRPARDSATPSAALIRVRLTPKQIKALAEGEPLLFNAGDRKLLLVAKRA